jgi:hypothetical protein
VHLAAVMLEENFVGDDREEYDSSPPEDYVIFEEIDNLVFQKIQEVVSNAPLDERFSEGFSDHTIRIGDQEKPLSDVIKNFDFQKLYNLILRIQNELNERKNYKKEAPNPQAVLAIKGVMNSITRIEEDRIISVSDCDEVNQLIVHCFEIPKNYWPRPCNLDDTALDFSNDPYDSLDHYYYVYIVGNLQNVNWYEIDEHRYHLNNSLLR